ncbi:hypothetical protein H8R18_06745 [Nanchangia anserum]|uniref:Uncharacterized protein n=1 Tax=Nanchangia anserum TaxID=2692125 RepID=A0A8I0GBQ4_9ACTO|nr:hypothetical protein [Nanchangia anserum]MBD3689230.1 hypothetical protein [Nanchangia anserum]QOX81453.1 hypothetical protein H8R18_06745 [Nanchangia anserum]
MDTATVAIHVLSVIVVLAIIVALLVAIVRIKRAHAAKVEELNSTIDALEHQVKSWQSAADPK